MCHIRNTMKRARNNIYSYWLCRLLTGLLFIRQLLAGINIAF